MSRFLFLTKQLYISCLIFFPWINYLRWSRPPWMNRYIKNLFVAINDFHKKFVLPFSNTANLLMFENLQNQFIQSIHTSKQEHFNKISEKLCDPLTCTKCYWSLLKTILNKKKIPCIPPIFHNNKYASDFKEKSDIFNFFFANQYSHTKQQHITIWTSFLHNIL